MPLEFNFKAEELVKKGRTSWNLIKEIKQWNSTTSSYPRIPEEFIALFLTACDNDIESTIYTIERHYECKKVGPRIFNNRNIDSEELTKCMSILTVIAIPHNTHRGHGVVIFRLEDDSFHKFNIISQCKVATMVADLQVYENPPEAIEVILDMENFGFKLLAKMKINTLRVIFNYSQEGLPIQLKALHIINCTSVFNKLMVLFKMCMKQELIKLIKTYPPNVNTEEFVKNGLPIHCLPLEYGGTLGTREELAEQTVNKLRTMKRFFEEEETLRKQFNF